MRRGIAIALLLAGCHAHTTQGRNQAQPEAPPGEEQKTARPVRTTPHAMLDAQAMRRVQEALARHGERVEATGELDAQTERALRAFQRREDMPPTGLPDYDTLDKLGLDAKQIFLGGTARKTRQRNEAKR